MAGTFKALSNTANFNALTTQIQSVDAPEPKEIEPKTELDHPTLPTGKPGLRISGLVYNIHLQLPESRDGAVYDALFKSLKEHLL
jgi:hypothetical protein